MARLALRMCLLLAASLVSALVSEAAMRLNVERLPVSYLFYVHRAIKDQRPEVWSRLREYVPYLNLRTEDPETGWTFKPEMHSLGTNEDGQPYDATTSAEGFFTPDVPDRAIPQLVVLGDSFLSTFYVPHPIPWVLRRELKTPVYNLAVHGWGPDSYLAAYRKFAQGRRHSQVLVFSFMNDVTDVMNWANWKHDGPAGISFLTWIQQQTPADAPENTGNGWLDRHSLLWNLFKMTALDPSHPVAPARQPSAAPLPGVDPGRLEAFGSRDGGHFKLQLTKGFPFLVNDPVAFWPGGSYFGYLQSYFESLDRLRSAIEADGAQMVLIWIPSKERVYVPLLPAERRRRFVVNSTGDISGIEPVVAAYAAQNGVAFLDLTPDLSRRAAEGEKLYFTVDGHLNDDGNEVVGRLAASFSRSLSATHPAPIASEPVVMFHRDDLPISAPLTLSGATYRASIVRIEASAWGVLGAAESPASYLVRWPVSPVATPMFLVAKGTLRRGGLTIGLLKNEAWAQQISVRRPGTFDIALPVGPGSYAVVVANNLPEGTLENEFEIRQLGWAAPPK